MASDRGSFRWTGDVTAILAQRFLSELEATFTRACVHSCLDGATAASPLTVTLTLLL